MNWLLISQNLILIPKDFTLRLKQLNGNLTIRPDKKRGHYSAPANVRLCISNTWDPDQKTFHSVASEKYWYRGEQKSREVSSANFIPAMLVMTKLSSSRCFSPKVNWAWGNRLMPGTHPCHVTADPQQSPSMLRLSSWSKMAFVPLLSADSSSSTVYKNSEGSLFVEVWWGFSPASDAASADTLSGAGEVYLRMWWRLFGV